MTQHTQSSGSAATNFGFAVWITYGVLSGSGYWIVAALGALAIASAIVAHEHRRNAITIMDCTTVVYFVFTLITTIAIGPWLFKNYNVFLTWTVFALVTWTTLLIGFPFTIQYAREQTPVEVWEHPLFTRLNVILTVIFGLMFTVNAVLGVLALMTGHVIVLGLIVPIALLISAIVFSSIYPKSYAERFAPEWSAAQTANAAGATNQ
jgi:all-trans-retinol 13,14-reductase